MNYVKRPAVNVAALVCALCFLSANASATERITYPASMCTMDLSDAIGVEAGIDLLESSYAVSSSNMTWSFFGGGSGPSSVVVVCPLVVQSDDSNINDVDLWTYGKLTSLPHIQVFDEDGDYIVTYTASETYSGSDYHYDWGTITLANRNYASITATLGSADKIYSYSLNDTGVTY